MCQELKRLHNELSGLSKVTLSARLDTLARLLGMAALELKGVPRSPIEDCAFQQTGTRAAHHLGGPTRWSSPCQWCS